MDANTWIGRTFQRIGRMASKATMKGIDTNYIEVPEKPFIISALYRGMHFTNTAYTPGFNISYEGVEHEFFSTRSEFKLGLSNKLGVGISYRGLGVNLLFNLGNKSGNMFNIAFYQRRFGIELNMQTINDIGATTYYGNESYSLNPAYGINIVPGRGKYMIHASVAPCALITFASHFTISNILDLDKIDWNNPDFAQYRKELEELLNNGYIQVLDKKLNEMKDEYNDKTNVKFTISACSGQPLTTFPPPLALATGSRTV